MEIDSQIHLQKKLHKATSIINGKWHEQFYRKKVITNK